MSRGLVVGCADRGQRGLSTGLTGICALGGTAVPTGTQAGVGVDAHGCSEAPCRGVGVRGPALMPAADFARRWK